MPFFISKPLYLAENPFGVVGFAPTRLRQVPPLLHKTTLTTVAVYVRGAGRVSGQGGQNSARSADKFFRLPTLVFSLPTLPYVTVAHPAHRTEADLKEKVSTLATNQKGPSPPLRLT